MSASENGAKMADVRSCDHETVVPHHLMTAQPSAMGLKSGDEWAVPMCVSHHAALHKMGDEKLFFALRGIDAMGIARRLWKETQDYRAKAPIVRAPPLPNVGKKTRSTKILGSREKSSKND